MTMNRVELRVEKIYDDETFKRGPGSVAIKVPSIIAKRFALKVGSPVEYYIDGDALVLKFPKEKGEGGEPTEQSDDEKAFE